MTCGPGPGLPFGTEEPTMLRIWVSGAKGRMGQALCARLSQDKYELVPTDRDEVDATAACAVRAFADKTWPDVIINCTGYTDEDGCETDPDRAYRVNALAARNLALAADALGAKLVHLSTDDVFAAASRRPYNEFDIPAPDTVYGKSKLAGEEFVRTLCRRYLIVRSAWVYGLGRDFVSTVLSSAADPACPWLAVPTDRFASPTNADDLCAAIEQLIDHDTLGIYHIVCQGSCSRYDFAKAILQAAGMENCLKLHPIRAADAGSAPCYTVLDDMMLRLDHIPQPRPWRMALNAYIRALAASGRLPQLISAGA